MIYAHRTRVFRRPRDGSALRWGWECKLPDCPGHGVSVYWKRAMRGAMRHTWFREQVCRRQQAEKAHSQEARSA